MSLLDELPEWREHLAQVEAARERHNRVSTEATRAHVDYDAEMAQHRRKTEEAVMKGKPLPDHPPEPNTTIAHAVRFTLSALEDLHDEGKRLRIALLPDVERLAAERWEARRDNIREAVALLASATQEMSTDASELARIRDEANGARSAPVRPGPGSRTLTRWTEQDVVDAVQRTSADPYALAPLGAAEQRRIELGYGAPSSSPPHRSTTPSRGTFDRL